MSDHAVWDFLFVCFVLFTLLFFFHERISSAHPVHEFTSFGVMSK